MTEGFILAGAAIALALSNGSAFAASRALQSPPQVYAPPPMWTGIYAGLNVGGGVDTSSSVSTSGYSVYDWAAGVYNLPFGWTSPYRAGNAIANGVGVFGGGQVGYNYKIGADFILGFESDFQGTGIAGSGSSYGLAGDHGRTGQQSQNFLHVQSGLVNPTVGIGWMGTVRGRVGVLATPTILFFATGGLAYGNTYANVTTGGYHWHPGHEIGHPENPVTPTTASIDNVSVGWSAGGGAEWMFSRDWSAKLEALYYDLGSQSVSGQYSAVINPAAPNSIAIINAAITSVSYQDVIARAGLNYHFDFGSPAPMLAKY